MDLQAVEPRSSVTDVVQRAIVGQAVSRVRSGRNRIDRRLELVDRLVPIAEDAGSEAAFGSRLDECVLRGRVTGTPSLPGG